MKLNIFKVPQDEIEALKAKLESVGMASVHQVNADGWSAQFYFSTEAEPIDIPWVHDFAEQLAALPEVPTNRAYYGAYIWTKEGECFTLSFGKTHFYLREFCDSDFGLNLAKRIGDKDDVRQKSARRYAGRNRKDIRSYQRESVLDIESGESVDYLQAATRDPDRWGIAAKFGVSALFTLPLKTEEIPEFLEAISEQLRGPEAFSLPRTEIIKDGETIARCDRELVGAIKSDSAAFEEATHQLVGVDFVFSGNEQFYFKHFRSRSATYDSLGMQELQQFVREHGIRDDQILDTKIKVSREDGKGYQQPLRKCLEYSIENEKVFLRRGEWVRFNEHYADYLDEYIDRFIEIDATLEAEFEVISQGEPAFNDLEKNSGLRRLGYESADKDFTIIQLRNYKIEAWDLKRGKTVYAVKFGGAQKLGYVCDQASNVLDIYQSEPATFKDLEIDAYCLWLGFSRVATPRKLSEVNSIIFKQKLEAWARKCRTMSIKPLVRISKKV